MAKKKFTKSTHTKKKAAKKAVKAPMLLLDRPMSKHDLDEEITAEMLQPSNVRERISISFREDLLDAIRAKAEELGIGYQVLIQMTLQNLFLPQAEGQKEKLDKRTEALLNLESVKLQLDKIRKAL
ncbi:MAG: hypothetical protein ACOH5I_25780 [Oligoflexus sp.]